MPPDVKYIIPTEDDIQALVKAFTVTFSDYFVPMSMDEAHLREFMHLNDIDLGLSVLAVTKDGEPIGQTLSGRRGELGWVGGAGLHPDHRRKGIALEMMRKQLKAFYEAGVQEVLLEVLSQNVRAKKLYDGLGFHDVRELQYYRNLTPDVGSITEPLGHRFEEASAAQALEFYTPDHPWQTMRESVARMKDARAFMSFKAEDGNAAEELGLGMPDTPRLPDEMLGEQGQELDGYCIYREFEKGISVVDLYSASDPGGMISQLILMTGGRPVYAHHVFDETIARAYEAAGFESYLMQYEMNRYRTAVQSR